MDVYTYGKDVASLEARVKHLEAQLAELKENGTQRSTVEGRACTTDGLVPVADEDRGRLRQLWMASQSAREEMQTILRKYCGANATISSLHTEALHRTSTETIGAVDAFTVQLDGTSDARPMRCYVDPPGVCWTCGVAE